METFDPDWLTMREPLDAAARSVRVVEQIAAEPRRTMLHGLDLGSGTGANVRFLAGRLPFAQDWLLVDHDSALVAHLPASMAAWAVERGYTAASDSGVITLDGMGRTCRLTPRVADLASVDLDELVGDRELVTASALLDLVSEAWLRKLVRACSRRRARVLFALTYDGRTRCHPADTDDETIRHLVNRHQRRDKGFGQALGPAAADRLDACLRAGGYNVTRDASDWTLSPEAGTLQRRLIEGWAGAAVAMAPDRQASINRWRDRRLEFVERGCSSIMVGHADLAGRPGAKLTLRT